MIIALEVQHRAENRVSPILNASGPKDSFKVEFYEITLIKLLLFFRHVSVLGSRVLYWERKSTQFTHICFVFYAHKIAVFTYFAT